MKKGDLAQIVTFGIVSTAIAVATYCLENPKKENIYQKMLREGGRENYVRAGRYLGG